MVVAIFNIPESPYDGSDSCPRENPSKRKLFDTSRRKIFIMSDSLDTGGGESHGAIEELNVMSWGRRRCREQGQDTSPSATTPTSSSSGVGGSGVGGSSSSSSSSSSTSGSAVSVMCLFMALPPEEPPGPSSRISVVRVLGPCDEKNGGS